MRQGRAEGEDNEGRQEWREADDGRAGAHVVDEEGQGQEWSRAKWTRSKSGPDQMIGSENSGDPGGKCAGSEKGPGPEESRVLEWPGSGAEKRWDEQGMTR